MLIDALKEVQDPKRARILEGAMKVFLAYGYSRVTMDDIARAAEVSRPALYLVFKNKSEIYRALGTLVLDASVDAATKLLAGEGPFAERAMAAIECSLIALMKPVLESPHGAELLDMKNTLAGDLAAMWRERLGKAFGDAISAEASRSGADLAARGLTPAALADLLLDGLEGMKSRVTNPEEHREGARRLVTVIGLALRA
jgi:AcrR family transcriptional regulator